MSSRYDDAVAKGRRAGIVLAAALLYGCGAGAQPLRLPHGHPAHPGTAETSRTPEPPAPDEKPAGKEAPK